MLVSFPQVAPSGLTSFRTTLQKTWKLCGRELLGVGVWAGNWVVGLCNRCPLEYILSTPVTGGLHNGCAKEPSTFRLPCMLCWT